MKIELIKKFTDSHQGSILKKDLDYQKLLEGLYKYFNIIETDNYYLYSHFNNLLSVNIKENMEMAIILEGILNYIWAYGREFISDIDKSKVN